MLSFKSIQFRDDENFLVSSLQSQFAVTVGCQFERSREHYILRGELFYHRQYVVYKILLYNILYTIYIFTLSIYTNQNLLASKKN